MVGLIKNIVFGLNYSRIKTSCEEKELLAEELGHYYHNALYNANTDKLIIEQKEYRANKWKNTILITINDFKEAFNKRNEYCL